MKTQFNQAWLDSIDENASGILLTWERRIAELRAENESLRRWLSIAVVIACGLIALVIALLLALPQTAF